MYVDCVATGASVCVASAESTASADSTASVDGTSDVEWNYRCPQGSSLCMNQIEDDMASHVAQRHHIFQTLFSMAGASYLRISTPLT